MNIKKIEKKYQLSIKYILENSLGKAFKLIENQLEGIQRVSLKDEFQQLKQTYSFMLHFALSGAEDPQRESVYKSIQTGLLSVSSQVQSEQLALLERTRMASEKKILTSQINKERLSASSMLNQIRLLPEGEEVYHREALNSKLFNYLWLSDVFTAEDNQAVKKSTFDSKILPHEKSLIVSGITIGILQNFNERKIKLLFDFYNSNQTDLWQRALAGLAIVLTFYNKRLHLYPEIINEIEKVALDDDIQEFSEIIWMQFIKMQETKQISQKLHNEIIPEMKKYGTDIGDKLDLDKILSDSLIEDENPDWEEIFDDAPKLLDKMAEFSELQMDGSDVFMSAFSMLKHFPFFNTASNWFLPFDKDNYHIKTTFKNANIEDFDTLAGGLSRAPFICNSDKYSFCLNIAMMPEAQRSMMSNLFKMENDSLEEIEKDDKLLNKSNDNKHLITRYLQDIYRFFKLNPIQAEFNDIFEDKLDFFNSTFFKKIDKDNEMVRLASELSFKKHFYEQATKGFIKLEESGTNSGKIYEKVGFAFQKIKDFENALKYYNRAELFGIESLWISKKIAFCHRKLHNYTEALNYYRKVEKEQPDNMHTQANIGHCLLYSENYEEALKYYFKVEYFDPKNIKIIHPLAWCSFAAGKLDAAEKYARKLIEANPEGSNYFSLAHVLLAKGEMQEAADNYKKGISLSDFGTFEQSLIDDAKGLGLNKISKTQINLITDYLLLQ